MNLKMSDGLHNRMRRCVLLDESPQFIHMVSEPTSR